MAEDSNKDRSSTKIQGEGNRASAERYNKATRDFLEHDGMENAPNPAGQPEEASEWAEQKGRSRAKELDPEIHRDYDKPTGGNE